MFRDASVVYFVIKRPIEACWRWPYVIARPFAVHALIDGRASVATARPAHARSQGQGQGRAVAADTGVTRPVAVTGQSLGLQSDFFYFQ